jgi:hypothetical protein
MVSENELIQFDSAALTDAAAHRAAIAMTDLRESIN